VAYENLREGFEDRASMFAHGAWRPETPRANVTTALHWRTITMNPPSKCIHWPGHHGPVSRRQAHPASLPVPVQLCLALVDRHGRRRTRRAQNGTNHRVNTGELIAPDGVHVRSTRSGVWIERRRACLPTQLGCQFGVANVQVIHVAGCRLFRTEPDPTLSPFLREGGDLRTFESVGNLQMLVTLFEQQFDVGWN
jgi:hypothetical protein